MLATDFFVHVSELAIILWPPQSPDLNPIAQLWDVVEWGDFHHKFSALMTCYDVNVFQNLRIMFEIPRGIYAMN